jgi:uncharacterized membrane protein
MTTIKLRCQQRGGHMHVDLFMGPSGGTLALSGRLVMDPEQLKLLARVLAYGAVGTEGVDLVWEEP